MANAVLDAVDLDWLLLAGRCTLLDQSAGDLFPRCQERGVAVMAAGVFNSGLLANPVPGAPYRYAPAPSALVDRAQCLAAVCARHDVALAAAAIQFPDRNPAVTTLVVGARTADELRQDAALLATPVPDALWDDLRAEGIAV